VVGNGGGVDVGCGEIVIGRGSIGCGVEPSSSRKYLSPAAPYQANSPGLASLVCDFPDSHVPTSLPTYM